VTKEEVSNILNGVNKSLYAIHQAGLCHRDIRFSNIINFKKSIQLIDFGMAGLVESRCQLTRGARQKGLGTRLSTHSLNSTVTWSPLDDYEMFQRTIVDLITN
jgi:tRNA A-37 threonylcarbamoyl transferase component Bud32